MTAAARLVDAAPGGRLLVVGSTPPEARDLDLLVSGAEREELVALLAEAGFVGRGEAWARFAGCSVDAVELLSARDFGIDERELERVLADARPLAGYERLVVPAAADDLLVLARLLRWGGWKEKRRDRVERAAHGFAAAEGRAAAWGVAAELTQLRAIAGGARPPRRHAAPRLRARPRVVALSGIDGSGKSTQARALHETLQRLGYDVEVAWTPLSQNASLAALGRAVKALLRAFGRGRAGAPMPASGLHRDEGTELRDRNAFVRLAWTLLVALANGVFHARKARSADVVIFDRYLLDTAAHFRFRYGAQGTYRLQNLVVRALSPRPIASFFLDLPAQASLERKPDDRWTPDELRAQERLYREEAARLDVVRLDALRPKEEVCAEIAAAVWRALG